MKIILTMSLALLLVLSSQASGPQNAISDVNWNIVTTNFSGLNYVYTPFIVDGSNITLFTGGAGTSPGNGVVKLTASIQGTSAIKSENVIAFGPDLKDYNYFRAPRISRDGGETWMLVELAGCYAGCDSPLAPKSLGVYRSLDNGTTWAFIDFVNIDNSRYVSQWFAHTGLIFNARGDKEINLQDLTKNRFITLGEKMNLLVSGDGVNYKSVPIDYPFPKDRLVFASIAKTPYGYHLTSTANWSDVYYTTTIRHLFSKDLVHWYVLEENSYLKNPNFYKGLHLSYDEKSNRLWAISSCGSTHACGIVAWLKPRDYLKRPIRNKKNELAIGDYVYFQNKTAMIIEIQTNNRTDTYKIRYTDGTISSGFTREMFVLPLASYNRRGCSKNAQAPLCIGDAVYVNGALAVVVGYLAKGVDEKYALKFSSGDVDTGYSRSMISLP